MRLEDARLLTGRGRFVADITLPGLQEMAVLRSPHAHARIAAILDLGAKPGLAGAPDLLTAAELGPAARPVPLVQPRTHTPWPLAGEVVRYVGEPVAAVVGSDRYAAEDRLEQVQVSYEPLPAVASLDAAAAEGAPLVYGDQPANLAAAGGFARGDLDAAFAGAPVVVRAGLSIARGHGNPMETRGCVAQWQDGRLTLWTSAQSAHGIRTSLSNALGLPPGDVRVIVPDVGGGFGLKGHMYQEEILAALLARRTGRPVRWIEDRREHLLCTQHDREFRFHLELAAERDGRVRGLRARIDVDLGAYLWYGPMLPANAAAHILGPYQWPAVDVHWRGFFTHCTPTGAYRGAGRPSGAYAVERLLDRLAATLALDPAQVRRVNLIPPDRMPYDTGVSPLGGANLVYDSGNYPELLARSLTLFGYEEMRQTQAAARKAGRRLGIGLAMAIETTAGMGFEGCRLTLGPAGEVTLSTGATPQGQGHVTTLAHLAARELGLRPEAIRVITGDTDAIARGVGTFGSRTAVLAGNATLTAARDLAEQIRRRAATLLEAAPADVELAEGRAQVRGAPARSLALAEVAAATPEPLLAEHYAESSGPAIASGCQLCALEVDPPTGQVRILRYAAVDDCGRVLEPELVHGQVVGAIAQGVGSSLYERLVYSPEGQLLTTSFMDYLLPTSMEVPTVLLDGIASPSPRNALGVKGAGEGGSMTAAPALAAALEDALRPDGIAIDSLPVRPEELAV